MILNISASIIASESLTAQGVPVYLGAGNSGDTSINAYLFADGVEVVSSTNAKGYLSLFSGKNISDVVLKDEELKEFIATYKQKYEDRTPDSLLRIFSQKNDTLRDLENPLENKLIPLRDFLTGMGYQSEEVDMEVNSRANYIHFSGLLFDSDDKGLVYHTEDGSNTPGVSSISGTSFSAPRALARDIKQKMENQVQPASPHN